VKVKEIEVPATDPNTSGPTLQKGYQVGEIIGQEWLDYYTFLGKRV